MDGFSGSLNNYFPICERGSRRSLFSWSWLHYRNWFNQPGLSAHSPIRKQIASEELSSHRTADQPAAPLTDHTDVALTLQSSSLAGVDREILDSAELKPWLLSKKPPENRVHIYLVRFAHADSANASVTQEAIPGECDTALLNLPDSYLGSACYRVTDADYLIINSQNQVEFLETLSVETTAIQMQQLLLESMASHNVVGFVQGEIIEDSDSCILCAYLRGFRNLTNRISDIAKSDSADFQVLTVDEQQPGRESQTNLPDYLPIVQIGTSLEIVAFEMLASGDTQPPVPADTADPEAGENQITLSSSSVIRNAIMALSLLRKEEILETRLNISVSFELVRDGIFTGLLNDFSVKTGKSLSGLDFEIYDMPNSLPFDKEVKVELNSLRASGHRLFVTDSPCLFDMQGLLKDITVDGMKADSVINNNLDNPLIEDVLSWYVEQARLNKMQLYCSGINSENAFRKIKRLDVNYASGTYFGPSEKIDSIFRKIRKVLER